MNEVLEQFIQSLRSYVSSDWTIQTLDPTTIEIRSSKSNLNGKHNVITVNVGEIYHYIPVQGIDQAISLAIHATLDVLRSSDTDFFRVTRDEVRKSVRPVLRSKDDPLLESGRNVSDNCDIYREEIDNVVRLFYVLDRSNVIIPVDLDALIDLRLSPSQLKEWGYENLKSLLEHLSWFPVIDHLSTKVFAASVQNDCYYSSSLVLLQEFWYRAKHIVGGEPIAAIPFHDILVVAPDTDHHRKALSWFVSTIIEKRATLGCDPLSRRLWCFDHGKLYSFNY